MTTSDLAIRARGLSKSYTIAHDGEQRSTLAEVFLDKLRRPLAKSRSETFWAVKDLDFDIRKGDVVGIIGRNGAGKSTLLKILSRITEPTSGEALVYGRVGSLLEVGTGFHPELTGRENVFLNGAILGMRRADISRHFDAIVEFAGVAKFLDTPVKRYSSGMYVRLAFAVAAHLDSEILVVDEVLAVGDAEFQKRCIGKIKDVSSGGRTVLFVTHNMNSVASLCNRAMLLEQGRIATIGRCAEVLQAYASPQDASTDVDLSRKARRERRLQSAFRQLTLRDDAGRARCVFEPVSAIRVGLEITAECAVREPRIGIGFNNSQGLRVFAVCSFLGRNRLAPFDRSCRVQLRFQLPALPPGRYTMDISLSDGTAPFIDELRDAASIEVEDNNYLETAFPYFDDMGQILVRSEWDTVAQ